MPLLPKNRTDADQWFDAQVNVGLKEADDPTTIWVDNMAVRKEWDTLRTSLAKRIKNADKSA